VVFKATASHKILIRAKEEEAKNDRNGGFVKAS
jgi:hypothetical protein